MNPGATRKKGGRYSKFDPRTQHGPLWMSRLRHVIETEPELEPFAIAERFGLDDDHAAWIRNRALRGDRRLL